MAHPYRGSKSLQVFGRLLDQYTTGFILQKLEPLRTRKPVKGVLCHFKTCVTLCLLIYRRHNVGPVLARGAVLDGEAARDKVVLDKIGLVCVYLYTLILIPGRQPPLWRTWAWQSWWSIRSSNRRTPACSWTRHQTCWRSWTGRWSVDCQDDKAFLDNSSS